MAKVYTDLEQSKRLAEFLPIESADGYWFKGFPAQPYMVYTAGTPNPGEHIPCWSLAALMSIIKGKLCHYNDRYYCQFIEEVGDFPIYSTSEYDNPIDCCVEMIVELHNKELL